MIQNIRKCFVKTEMTFFMIKNDILCASLHYIWERREILYVDDAGDPTIPWLQMAAEQGRTVKYVVNPDYKMPKEQDNYKG